MANVAHRGRSAPEKTIQFGRSGQIGVVGAAGQLGTMMVQTAARHGFSVTAFAARRVKQWPAEVQFFEHHRSADWSALAPSLAQLGAVVIAAPLGSAALHKLCLEQGCHVVDVGISADAIRACLALDDLARTRGVNLVVMGGLAPGLSGLLGIDMARRHPQAALIEVTLVQSARGTAGAQGVRDMLDMLTDRSLSPVIGLHEERHSTARHRAFTLPTAETEFLPSGPGLPAIRYATLFDSPLLNRLAMGLGWIRARAPSLYRTIRDLAAASKAGKAPPVSEQVNLIAVAVSREGGVLDTDRHSFVSDYGATAGVAMALAKLAIAGELGAGAGHPAQLSDWRSVTSQPSLRDIAWLKDGTAPGPGAIAVNTKPKR